MIKKTSTRLFILLCYLGCWIGFSTAAKEAPSEIFSQGIVNLQQGNLKKAKSLFEKVTKLEFGHYPSYFNISLIYLNTGDYKKSIKSLEKAKKFNPYDLRVDALLATSFIMTKKTKNAKEALSTIISKKPDDINSHKKLGILHLQEGNLKEALSEFTTIKNLSPADQDVTQLLETAQNKTSNKLINSLKSNIVTREIESIKPAEKFELSEVSKRIVKKLKKEEEQTAPAPTVKKPKKKLPFNTKATLTETFELYDRSPQASSPINKFHSASNLKFQGKIKKKIDYTTQLEWFFNTWDHTVLDYYKVNFKERDKYEVDVGKFSAKHFPKLVSYPTVNDGLRIWKKFKRPDAQISETSITETSNKPINLGELYRKNQDLRWFKSAELTYVIGRTLAPVNLDRRKEKNEDTYETSGQFEQWTTAVRAYTKVNSFSDFGVSFALTQDREHSANISSSTNPITSKALGIDGNFSLLNDKLSFDWEIARSDYDENSLDPTDKHLEDKAWYAKFTYKPQKEYTFSYEHTGVEKSFKVEGAYQTEDKLSHIINAQFKPSEPKTWSLKSLSLKFQPEETNFRGYGTSRKKYRTFQPVVDIKLPDDAKLTLDYKYYREYDKCVCSSYRTRKLKSAIEWEAKPIKTTFKPSYTFERKDDRVAAATDENLKETVLTIENKLIKNLTVKGSIEREIKTYVGATTKSYHQHVYSAEAKYDIVPSRFDAKFKLSRDRKDSSDTNDTDIITLTWELNYTSKDRDHKIALKIERKNNTYDPWSETSAYRQNYAKLKYTYKF
ncbi:MAG: hypothetical protein GY858_02740 [Candidatus Omnitrophica bacterium]|nr:hypothetical protein [Candidatus Omnitrophota bacterium]